MNTLKFNKTECGVDFLLNVLSCKELRKNYFSKDYTSTDFFEVFFFKKGNGNISLHHKNYTIKDDSILFVSPYQNRLWNVDSEKLEFTLLIFQEDFLNDFFSDKLFTYRMLYFYQLEFPLLLSVSKELFTRYIQILTEIKIEIKTTKPDSVHIIRSLIYYLLQKLNRDYAELNKLGHSKVAASHAFQFKMLIEKYITEKQRINDYTSLLSISRVTLNKAVKMQFHITANDLLKRRLLVEIKDLLLHSRLTVGDITQKLHFSEPNHLMRFFKKQTGMTILQFLNAYQNGIIS